MQSQVFQEKRSWCRKPKLPDLGFHAWTISHACATEDFKLLFVPQFYLKKTQIKSDRLFATCVSEQIRGPFCIWQCWVWVADV